MGELAPWAICVSQLLGAAVQAPQVWPEQARRVVSVFGDSTAYDELLDLIDEGVCAPTDLAERLEINGSTLRTQLMRLEARGIITNTARGQWRRASMD